MNCNKILFKLSAYIDNELKDTEKLVIERHIHSCAVCAQELKILLNNEVYVKQLTPLRLSDNFQTALTEKLAAEAGKADKQTGFWGMFARFWIPVPVICAAMIIAFIGFTALSPLVYATADNLKNISELPKSAFSNISAKNIVGPLNYMDFCNKCHMALCENCKKGQACNCK
jgi:anti-sigma factor RsiW